MADSPESARWLEPDEKQFLKSSMKGKPAAKSTREIFRLAGLS